MDYTVEADGVVFVVEAVDGDTRLGHGVDDEGPRTVSDDSERGPLSFVGVADTVRAIGGQLTQAWESVGPDEASVEFGLKLTAKTGRLTGLLVDGGGEATLAVKMTWKRDTAVRPHQPSMESGIG